MAYGYIQAFLQFPNAKNGTLKVFLANSTTEAILYDPVNGNPVSQPISIDSEGFSAQFWAETELLFDLHAYDYIGNPVETRNNVSVLGGSAGAVGPQGPQGVQGPAGATGATGSTGAAGADGTNGTDGEDGTDGVSLVSIRVDETSSTGKILYNLSSDPNNWIDAGDIVPAGLYKVKATEDSTESYLNDFIEVDNNLTITKSASGVVIHGPNLQDITDELADHETRIDALESAVRVKQVLFGGAVGDTTVTIPHTLGTSNLAVSCYNAIDNSLIFLNVIVTDTQVSIQGLTPLTSNNQIKVVLVK